MRGGARPRPYDWGGGPPPQQQQPPRKTAAPMPPGVLPTGMVTETAQDGNMKEEREVNPVFLKTKFCKFYERGVCTRGDECQFAHTEEDLHPQSFYRTRLCRKLVTTGRCDDIANCGYAHSREELRVPADSLEEAELEKHQALGGQVGTRGMSREHLAYADDAAYAEDLELLEQHELQMAARQQLRMHKMQQQQPPQHTRQSPQQQQWQRSAPAADLPRSGPGARSPTRYQGDVYAAGGGTQYRASGRSRDDYDYAQDGRDDYDYSHDGGPVDDYDSYERTLPLNDPVVHHLRQQILCLTIEQQNALFHLQIQDLPTDHLQLVLQRQVTRLVRQQQRQQQEWQFDRFGRQAPPMRSPPQQPPPSAPMGSRAQNAPYMARQEASDYPTMPRQRQASRETTFMQSPPSQDFREPEMIPPGYGDMCGGRMPPPEPPLRGGGCGPPMDDFGGRPYGGNPQAYAPGPPPQPASASQRVGRQRGFEPTEAYDYDSYSHPQHIDPRPSRGGGGSDGLNGGLLPRAQRGPAQRFPQQQSELRQGGQRMERMERMPPGPPYREAELSEDVVVPPRPSNSSRQPGMNNFNAPMGQMPAQKQSRASSTASTAGTAEPPASASGPDLSAQAAFPADAAPAASQQTLSGLSSKLESSAGSFGMGLTVKNTFLDFSPQNKSQMFMFNTMGNLPNIFETDAEEDNDVSQGGVYDARPNDVRTQRPMSSVSLAADGLPRTASNTGWGEDQAYLGVRTEGSLVTIVDEQETDPQLGGLEVPPFDFSADFNSGMVVKNTFLDLPEDPGSLQGRRRMFHTVDVLPAMRSFVQDMEADPEKNQDNHQQSV
eukprot:TRINITY_DN83339_c0_g1_i1.p1 TRINITY_DN83339_c0_g1~~TRINITY_DN83339_c0_g1_i1.p1  ORF type:complete len:830 (+),score=148.64 TRINITY_DN83339_c0_g1_i1:147-2636(+)